MIEQPLDEVHLRVGIEPMEPLGGDGFRHCVRREVRLHPALVGDPRRPQADESISFSRRNRGVPWPGPRRLGGGRLRGRPSGGRRAEDGRHEHGDRDDNAAP